MSRREAALLAALLGGSLAGACRQDMHDQPRADALEPSAAFPDGRAARLPVAGTVARGALPPDPTWTHGVGADGRFADALPPGLPLDRALLERGRERFDIFCSACHARSGAGDGIVVQRGFPAPPDLRSEAVRSHALGSYVDVVARGYGRMPGFAAQVPPADRWAIAVWIRTLQLAERAPAELLTPADLERLAAAPPARDGAPR